LNVSKKLLLELLDELKITELLELLLGGGGQSQLFFGSLATGLL
jgi:hypothetical protein